jgi:SAM-dependent methyltransferase
MEILRDEYNKIKDMIQLAISNSDTELEVIFKNVSFNKDISKTDFNNIVSRLKSYSLKETSYTDNLDIRFLTGYEKTSNMRITINGISEIQKYCKHNDIKKIDGSKCEYISKYRFTNGKSKVFPIKIPNYSLKINLNKEVKVSKQQILSLQTGWTKKNKIFRLKKRYSFITNDNLFRYDLSIVKSSKKNKRGDSYIYSRDFEGSEILDSNEFYEIELEYIGGTRDKLLNLSGLSLDEKINFIFGKMVEYMGIILQVLQKSYFILPKNKTKNILLEYARLAKNNNKFKGYIDRKCWIGPQPISLSMKHIRIQKEEENVLFNIRKGYCVTEKADGERHLLYISKDKKIYLINNRFEVKYTGCTVKNASNCIFDGELITKNKKNVNIVLFLIFDLYFANNQDYRSRQFARTEDDKSQGVEESRLEILNTIITNEEFKYEKNNDTSEEEGEVDYSRDIVFNWKIKEFYFGDITNFSNKIFESTKIVLTKEKSNIMDYETDGVIFNPVKLPVGGYDEKGAHNKIGITWDAQFKWKPAKDNTIDFLVEVLQTKNNKGIYSDKIGYTYNDYMGTKKLVKYKTLILKTGFNPSMHKKINPCTMMIEGKELSFNHKEYISKEFQPNFPEDKEAYLANIEIKGNTNNERMLCIKDNNEIETNMIIEMSYDKNKEQKWRWIPRNVRYDKTAQLRNGDSQYGNPFHVAESIWKSYHNPISEEMITTGNNIPDETQEEEVYYSRIISRNKSETKPMLDFHNLFVKYKLIKSVCEIKKAENLIDLACGKAGDLPKWKKSNLKFVFGVDISRDNIENLKDGACVRCCNQKEELKKIKTVFCVADTSKNLKNLMAAKNDEYKKILSVMYGKSSINKTTLSSGFQEIWNKAENKFDIVSLQFALHYYFKDLKSLNGLIQNIKENIKEGGYFIGTCFDGETVFNKLKKVKENSFIEGFKNRTRIWRIKKGYSNNELNDDHTSLGIPIWVYVETINKVFKEYLVNFKYLVSVMKDNGFELENNRVLLPYNLESSSLFSNLFQKLEKTSEFIGSSMKMSAGEKDFSFMFRYFIFKYSPKKNKIKDDSIVVLKKKKKVKRKK